MNQIEFTLYRSEFIEENLIFYTVLFKMFMQRATRLDLHFLKDVQFIFRVTKVFFIWLPYTHKNTS